MREGFSGGARLRGTGGAGKGRRPTLLFLGSMLAHPRRVGAVWPTSGRAVRDLLGMAEIGRARRVVEFGAGTGVYTREILARMSAEARLLAFEVDGALASDVRERLADPRLRVVNDSAENLGRHLDGEWADVIVSSLPFTTLPAAVREGVLDASRRALAPGGAMLVLQYSTAILPALKRRFGRVRRRLSPLNVPPAFLYACEEPAAEPER